MTFLRGEVQIQTAMLCGSAALPKAAGPFFSEASVARLTHHSWQDTHFPWPFWLVSRASTHVECNCVLKTFTARQIMTFGHGKRDPLVDDMETRVPVMVNDKDVKKGEELRVFWQAREATKKKAQATKKSWVDVAKAELKRRKLHAPSKDGGWKLGLTRLSAV